MATCEELDIDVYIRVPEHSGEGYKAVIYCYNESPHVLRAADLDTLMGGVSKQILVLIEKVVAKKPR